MNSKQANRSLGGKIIPSPIDNKDVKGAMLSVGQGWIPKCISYRPKPDSISIEAIVAKTGKAMVSKLPGLLRNT